MDWPEIVATELGIEGWDPHEHDLLLDLVREVAHGTERRYGPLTAYLVGVLVGSSAAQDATAASGRRPDLDRLVAALRAALPTADE